MHIGNYAYKQIYVQIDKKIKSNKSIKILDFKRFVVESEGVACEADVGPLITNCCWVDLNPRANQAPFEVL